MLTTRCPERLVECGIEQDAADKLARASWYCVGMR